MLVAIDTETTEKALTANDFTLHCISIAWFDENQEALTKTYRTVDELKRNLSLSKHTFVFHNAKFDLRILQVCGLDIPTWEDSLLLAYDLKSEPSNGGHSLADWGERLGYEKIDFNDFSAYSEEMARYCERDAEITLRVWDWLMDNVDDVTWNYYQDVEKPFLSVIMDMESNGYRLDCQKLAEAREALQSHCDELVQVMRSLLGQPIPNAIVKYKRQHPKKVEAGTHAYLGEDENHYHYQKLENFNPASIPHKVYVLEQMFGVTLAQNKTGSKKTGDDELEKFDDEGQTELGKFVSHLREYNEKAKILNTFVEGMLQKVKHNDGRIRANYNQSVTRTGRLSSSNPNLQNLPSSGEGGELIRRAIVPGEGNQLVCADVSQFQYRIAVWLLSQEYGLRSDVKHLVETYTKETGTGDIHEANRSMLERYAPELFGGETGRKTAKVYGFALLFGAQAKKISEISSLTREQAETVLNAGREQLNSFEDYKSLCIDRAKANDGTLRDGYGRKLDYPEVNDYNRYTRSRAERQLFNAIVQGTEATIIKLMGIQLRQNLPPEAKLCGVVHDEWLVECPPAITDTVCSTMEAVLSAEWLPSTREDVPSIPCLGEAHSGNNWKEAKGE